MVGPKSVMAMVCTRNKKSEGKVENPVVNSNNHTRVPKWVEVTSKRVHTTTTSIKILEGDLCFFVCKYLAN